MRTQPTRIVLAVTDRPIARPVAKAIAVGFLPLACMGSAHAQILSAGVDDSPGFHAPADARWRPIAVEDVDAAYQLLHDNHPGAAAEMHDATFVHRLQEAHARALQRAGTVGSYQGYAAVLAGLATEMGDKHIWSRPTFVVNMLRWPGVLISKRGNAWVVTDTEPSESTLLDASLISCDGRDIELLAQETLGAFRAVWSVGAQQVQAAPWLLVDEGNPFITRPNSCVFHKDGKDTAVNLKWSRIKRENLLPKLKKAVGVGAAGFGVRRVGDGYWIALQDLVSEQALAVVRSVEQQKSVLREAQFVVLDLRGNGGGSSELGREIATSLLGKAAMEARLGQSAVNGCMSTEVFRATKGNLAQLEYLRSAPFVVNGDPEQKNQINALVSRVRAALAAGRVFSGAIGCAAAPQASVKAQVPSLLKGRLILLTDSACFSSCLAVTDDFRTLGAFHVGQTTDAATWYVDVREQYLPSGYSLFSTLQAVSGDSPAVGPFVPSLIYDGDIANTTALEQWIGGTVIKRLRAGSGSGSAGS